MNISLILAHPNKDSFNHSIAQRAHHALEKQGIEVSFHDLYAESFQPILYPKENEQTIPFSERIKPYKDEIWHSKGILIVHPDWWGMPPAVLVGWLDRLLSFNPKKGLLREENFSVLIFNTADTIYPSDQDTLYTIWKDRVFGFYNITHLKRKIFSPIKGSSPQQRALWLDSVEKLTVKWAEDIFGTIF